MTLAIRKLTSGIAGLDEVLGGGIPELSFNLIIGGPGCGKTTLGHHIAFANAAPERKVLYFTIVGEPPIKMLRYQQQFSFFDTKKVGDQIRFVNLGEAAFTGGLTHVLERIIEEVERVSPTLVIVDSFRSIVRQSNGAEALGVQDFIQRLALHLTSCEATTFLLGEYATAEDDNPVFTVADGIIALHQSVDRNSIVRKLQVVKMRGQGQIPGLQTIRIDNDGLSVFPRLLKPADVQSRVAPLADRVLTGIVKLDEMLGGGIPRGYSVLVAGPSGSGKTVLTNQFIAEGMNQDEPGIIAVFEKRPSDYQQTTPYRETFDRMIAKGKLGMLYLRPLDLSIDETLVEMRNAVKRFGAKRAVIDSLSGLELALAPTFRDDFRESLYRMVGALTGLGVTVMSTVELTDSFDALRFSPQGIAFLTDAIIIQRYVEIDAEVKRALSVIKVRGSQHSKDMREYAIGPDGQVAIGAPLKGYSGLLTGAPRRL